MIRDIIGKYYRKFLKWLVGIIPKNKELILFSAWFGEKYADNSKYLFEYMLKHSSYKVYWFTKNQELYKKLRAKNIPVLFSKSLKARWLQSRAVVLVSTVQTNDFNQLLLNKCIYLDLDHGFPGKPVGLAQPTVDAAWRNWYYFCMEGIEFYQTASSRFVADFSSSCYDVDYDHFLFTNKPRIDILFKNGVENEDVKYIDSLINGRRIILYLPTHRSCGKQKIDLFKVFNLTEIQKLCEETSSVFVIKKHFYHKEEYTNLDLYPNIVDITQSDIDTQVLLSKADVLVTDFSSCFIDFLALDRPIIFYAYDYEDYLINDRDFYWKYDKITAGFTIKDKDSFTHTLMHISKDWTDHTHAHQRVVMRNLYFDPEVEMGNSCEKLVNIIGQLINKTYVPFDWSLKS